MPSPSRSCALMTALLVAASLAAADKPQGPVLKTKFGDVEIFPADNPWNTDISKLPVHPKSKAWLSSIGLDKPLHPDFGTVWNGAPNGIPYVVVDGKTTCMP